MRAAHKRLRSRGSLLVAALLLFSLLLALGLGLMSSQSARMKAAQAQTQSIAAKELCDAAWEDVRVKLGKDILFPLPVAGQDFFSYSEDVYFTNEAGAQEYLGSYTVIVDVTLDSTSRENNNLALDTDVEIPQGMYGITCIGKVGKRTEPPEAERVVYYEITMTDVADPSNDFKVIRCEDRSSL